MISSDEKETKVTFDRQRSIADSESFILPDGQVLTLDQMEAMLKKKAASVRHPRERAEAQMELARFYLSIAKPLKAYPILEAILPSTQEPERKESCEQLLELIRGGRKRPPSERAREQYAEMLIRLGRAFFKRYPTAWAYLRKAASMIKSQKKMAECLLDMGRLCERIDNYDDAVQYYSQALTMPQGTDDTWYWLNNNLGYSLARLERYAEAETYCRRAIAINRFRLNAHKNLGLSLRGQGKFLDAATSFLVASISCPDDKRALNHLGEMLKDHPELRQGIVEALRDRLEARKSFPKTGRSRNIGATN